MKIDIFAHIMPERYLNALSPKLTDGPAVLARTKAVSTLYDLDARFRVMDMFPDVKQVLSVAMFPIDSLIKPDDAAELAKIANDQMAELVLKYPGRFIGAAACLPMNDVDASLRETDRAIKDLKMKGVLLFAEIGGEPLDAPKFRPLYQKMVEYDLPIWIHPNKNPVAPQYPGEKRSRYLACHVFTWPYQTALAMNRLVYSGIMEDYPGLKIITHHCGGLVPFLAHRIPEFYDCNLALEGGAAFDRRLTKPPIAYFRQFYGDTVTCGSVPALVCGYSFFGAEHIVFATDMPYDAELGARQTRESIAAVKQLDIPDGEKAMIFEGNARALLHLV